MINNVNKHILRTYENIITIYLILTTLHYHFFHESVVDFLQWQKVNPELKWTLRN